MTPGFFQPVGQVDFPSSDILSWMFDQPGYDLNKTIYVSANDPSRSLTAGQCRDTIRRFAKGLQTAGFKKGDTLLLHSFNDISYPLVALGTIAAGGIWTGSNPAYTASELVHHMRSADVRFIISEPETIATVREAGDQVGIPAENYWIFDNLPSQQEAILKEPLAANYRSWRSLLCHGETDWVRFQDEATSASTTAMRLFSSGTTGLPKAANISHQNLIAQHTVFLEYRRIPYVPVFCLPLPMFHAACAPSAIISMLRSSIRCLVMRRFDLDLYLNTVRDYGVTHLSLVPPMVLAMVMSPKVNASFFKSVRIAASGAAPLSLGIQKRFQKLLPERATMTQAWGMTETTCIATKFFHGESDDTGSVGRLLPGLEAKLIDDDGREIRVYNQIGEMCVRGKTVFQGYYNNDEANRQSFDAEGYYKTGDVMMCDGASKLWYIVDRKKELIKVRGFQVVPPEIEAVLLSHADVIDAAVIGVPSPDGEGELPRAYVVKRPSSRVTSDELFEYCRLRLASYKRLDGGIVFLDQLPKNASGKILKKTLREMAKKEGIRAKL
ncbi:amp dependent CoA ligase [Pyronema omphalodes]|nr:amp dependent CoA ligase [Pyronema omphalodes]